MSAPTWDDANVGTTMQVWCQYMFSKAEINSDSNYVLTSAFVRGMADVRPGWHFWVPFPDQKSGFKYDDDGFFDLPNVTRVSQRMNPRRHGGAVHFDSIWYDRLFRSVAIDVAWCNLVEMCGNIKFSGDSSYNDTFKPVVVAAHNYTIHKSLPYNVDAMANIYWAQLVGSALADWNVYNSDHTRSMVMDNARESLADDIVQRIDERSSRIHLGTLEPSLTYHETGNEIPVILYNHRLQGYKRWRDTMEVLDELHKEGIKFRLRYTNTTRENFGLLAAYPWVECRLSRTRAEYIEALRGCDLNVLHSQHETFCISAVESMACGQPLVAPNGITFPEITGRTVGTEYPYLFNNQAECKTMLRRLLTDAAERKKWGRVLSDHVRASFNATRWAETYSELFERLDAERVWTPKPGNAEAFRETMDAHDGRPFMEFYRNLMKVKVNGRGPFGAQSCPLARASRMVRRFGGGIAVRNGKQYLCARVKS